MVKIRMCFTVTLHFSAQHDHLMSTAPASSNNSFLTIQFMQFSA
jgi:hypothetical protein